MCKTSNWLPCFTATGGTAIHVFLPLYIFVLEVIGTTQSTIPSIESHTRMYTQCLRLLPGGHIHVVLKILAQYVMHVKCTHMYTRLVFPYMDTKLTVTHAIHIIVTSAKNDTLAETDISPAYRLHRRSYSSQEWTSTSKLPHSGIEHYTHYTNIYTNIHTHYTNIHTHYTKIHTLTHALK